MPGDDMQPHAHPSHATQLMRRVRSTQAFPFHRVHGLDRQALLAALVQHLDPHGSGKVEARWAATALRMLNPRCDAWAWEG